MSLTTVDSMESVATAMREELLARLGDGVDLVFEYGSQLKGNTHRCSDLDIAYVPAHETTWISITVQVGGTLFDLFPLQWSNLERMSEFDNQVCSLLLVNRIVYAKNEETAWRFEGLKHKLEAFLDPANKLNAVKKAQSILQRTGYPHLMLRFLAKEGDFLGCLQQSHTIVESVLHCLAVCNQSCVDTRKLDQIRALKSLPEGFATLLEKSIDSVEPSDLSDATEALLESTRNFLLSEQRKAEDRIPAGNEVFHAMYPEAKGDLDHLALACEAGDTLRVRKCVVSLYQELIPRIEQTHSGFGGSDFTNASDFGIDLSDFGFPDLLEPLRRRDYKAVAAACPAFDRRLREFFHERAVGLNDFRDLEDLQLALTARSY